MGFAILRTAKLTTMGEIGGSAAHNYRERSTPNADPAASGRNEHHGCRSGADLVKAVKARLATVQTAGGKAIRKDAVRCIEYLVTASPDWFKQGGDDAGYFRAALDWLKERHGAENVVAYSIHRDETSPHLVAYVVPITADGRLSAKAFLGSRTKLRKMQSEFADRVGKPYGLQRGIEGSQAQHQTVKRFYGAISRPFEPLPPVNTPPVRRLPPPTIWERIPFTDARRERKRLEAVLEAQARHRWQEISKRQAAALAIVERVQDQAKAGMAMGDQLKASRNEIERLRQEAGKLRAQVSALEQKVQAMQHERKEIYRQVAKMIKSSFTPAQFAETFGVEMKGKQDIFEALVKAGKAPDFKSALEMVARRMPTGTESSWSDLAKWSLDYQKSEMPLSPETVPPPHATGADDAPAPPGRAADAARRSMRRR